MQEPEQHWLALVQALPFGLQSGPASIPASVGIRQIEPNSSPMHCPLQQAVPPTVQPEPSGTQSLWLHRRIPVLSGTQGAPSQH